MTNDEIFQSVVKEIAQLIRVKKILPDLYDSQLEELGFDSFQRLELLLRLESKFGIQIEESEIAKNKIRSINDLFFLVQNKRKDSL